MSCGEFSFVKKFDVRGLEIRAFFFSAHNGQKYESPLSSPTSPKNSHLLRLGAGSILFHLVGSGLVNSTVSFVSERKDTISLPDFY